MCRFFIQKHLAICRTKAAVYLAVELFANGLIPVLVHNRLIHKNRRCSLTGIQQIICFVLLAFYFVLIFQMFQYIVNLGDLRCRINRSMTQHRQQELFRRAVLI